METKQDTKRPDSVAEHKNAVMVSMVIIVLLVIASVALFKSRENPPKTPEQMKMVQEKARRENPPKTPEQIKMEQEKAREEDLQRHFSAWDGSHRGLTGYIKNAMNDPGSYEHVKTVYWDRKDHLVVMTTFRGKNAFGGLVVNSVKAKVDLAGNVLEIIETQP